VLSRGHGDGQVARFATTTGRSFRRAAPSSRKNVREKMTYPAPARPLGVGMVGPDVLRAHGRLRGVRRRVRVGEAGHGDVAEGIEALGAHERDRSESAERVQARPAHPVRNRCGVLEEQEPLPGHCDAVRRMKERVLVGPVASAHRTPVEREQAIALAGVEASAARSPAG